MAQTTQITIDNQTFPSFRSKLNESLSALNTLNSGSSRPSSAVAGTIWLDTTNATNPTLKFFDGSDDISLATIDYSANTVNWLDSSVSLTSPVAVSGNSTAGAEIRLPEDTDNGSNYVGLKASDTIASNITFTLPNADGSNGQSLKTDGSGNLSFGDVVGGTDWQTTPKTANFNASANEGYFVDTSSNVVTVTLPTGVAGESVTIIDYVSNANTNAIIFTPQSGEKIEGGTSGQGVTANRQATTLTYSGATQGWLVSSSGDSTPITTPTITFNTASGSLGTLAGSSQRSDPNANLSAVTGSSTFGTVGYSIQSGSLPAGLTLNSSSGAFVGTATAQASSTTSNFTVRITVTETGTTSDRAFSIIVDPDASFVAGSGGTETTSGDFKIHTFTGPGTFTVSDAGNAGGSNQLEYVVVAGGGGGGNSGCRGGGGGAGGFRFASPSIAPLTYPGKPLAGSTITASATAYPITVGGGGSAGSSGNNSVFSSITSASGGVGGIGTGAGGNGGSGGGGAGPGGGNPVSAGGSGNTPPVSPPQGNNGGNGDPSPPGFGGGGGGAIAGGDIGGSSPRSRGSDGGAGAGFPPTAFGSNGESCGSFRYYSGGAGAGYYGDAVPGGIGGAGGGGNGGGFNGSSGTPGTAGTTNTGGGGGGGSLSNVGASAGGSGIVIIRYKFQ